MGKSKLRSKNKIDNKKPILGLIVTGFCLFSSVKLLLGDDKLSFYLGLFFLCGFLIMLIWGYKKTSKIKKQLHYFDDFQDSDDWLPSNYIVEIPESLEEYNQFSSFDEFVKKVDTEYYVLKIDADLKKLHKMKNDLNFKLSQWDTIPVLSDDDFFDDDKRLGYNGREAVYSKRERTEIKQEFINKINFCENIISSANKLYNKLLDSGKDLSRNFGNTPIDGLSSSNE